MAQRSLKASYRGTPAASTLAWAELASYRGAPAASTLAWAELCFCGALFQGWVWVLFCLNFKVVSMSEY